MAKGKKHTKKRVKDANVSDDVWHTDTQRLNRVERGWRSKRTEGWEGEGRERREKGKGGEDVPATALQRRFKDEYRHRT